MTHHFHHFHINGKGLDISAILATATATLVSDWLQVIVLLLTIVFLILGIFMRARKLKDDDPSKD